jgi:hypothetical protein
MACKLSTDLNQVPRAAELLQQSIPTESVKGGRGFCVVGSRIFQEIWVTDFAWRFKTKGARGAPFCDGRLIFPNMVQRPEET